MLTWQSLTATLADMDEAEVQRLLDEEVVGKRRKVILRRLHQRLSALRAKREREVLLDGL